MGFGWGGVCCGGLGWGLGGRGEVGAEIETR